LCHFECSEAESRNLINYPNSINNSKLSKTAFNKTFYVYIMASKTGTLYVGMTNNIERRVYEHKNHLILGFTDKYKVERLLHVETTSDPLSAIKREKQIKAWRREKKVALIDSMNPQWTDLSEDWYE